MDFIQKYENVPDQDVEFTGKYFMHREISGTFKETSTGNTGQFSLKLVLDIWHGRYHDGIVHKNFNDLGIHVDANGIFGLGTDDRASYMLRGEWDQASTKIKWVKKYIDIDENHYYYGNASKGTGLFMILGNWFDDDRKFKGEFGLTKKLPPGERVSLAGPGANLFGVGAPKINVVREPTPRSSVVEKADFGCQTDF